MLLFTTTFAQNTLPPVYEIKSDTASYVNLERTDWQILEDQKGALTIDDISKPPLSNRFHVYDSAKYFASKAIVIAKEQNDLSLEKDITLNLGLLQNHAPPLRITDYPGSGLSDERSFAVAIHEVGGDRAAQGLAS